MKRRIFAGDGIRGDVRVHSLPIITVVGIPSHVRCGFIDGAEPCLDKGASQLTEFGVGKANICSLD
jgi:hypothetical protein